MNAKRWTEEIKKEIVKLANSMNEDSMEQDTGTLRQYVNILDALQKLPANEAQVAASTDGEMQEMKDDVNHVYIGRFRRELSGGTIGSFRIFVPESVVRNLRMEEGDWIRAKAVKSVVLKNGNMRTMYDYTLAQKTDETVQSSRSVRPFCRVSYDPYEDRLYIETEDLERIMIADNDVRHLDLGEGDLVDYAFDPDEPFAGRVVWKYKLPVVPADPEETGEIDIDKARLFFPERSFVVVGELQDALRIQDEIEEHGGLVSFFTGDERFDIMERIGTSADTVIVILDSVTPHGLSKINDIGEKYRLPMLYTRDTKTEALLKMLIDGRAEVPPAAQEM